MNQTLGCTESFGVLLKKFPGLQSIWFSRSAEEPEFAYLTGFYREGDGTPLKYSCLENLMDGGAWWAAVHEVAKSRTQLSDFTFTFHFHALEKEMATHSSVLAGRIPGMGEPGGLLSTGSHRVGHDWSDLAAAAATWIHRSVKGFLLLVSSRKFLIHCKLAPRSWARMEKWKL